VTVWPWPLVANQGLRAKFANKRLNGFRIRGAGAHRPPFTTETKGKRTPKAPGGSGDQHVFHGQIQPGRREENEPISPGTPKNEPIRSSTGVGIAPLDCRATSRLVTSLILKLDGTAGFSNGFGCCP